MEKVTGIWPGHFSRDNWWQKTADWWWSERIWVIFNISMIGNNSSTKPPLLPSPSAVCWRIISQVESETYQWSSSAIPGVWMMRVRSPQHPQIMVTILCKNRRNEQKFILNPWYKVLEEDNKNKWEFKFLFSV